VLASDRAVYHGRPGSIGNGARGSNRDRAVDDRQSRLVEIDVSGGFADEVLDLERETDMQYAGLLDFLNRVYVHAYGVEAFRQNLEKGLSHLSKSSDNNFMVVHGVWGIS
jgi:hypothetical protein